MSKHEPGVYVKGDSTREAETVADAVDLVWKGYTRSDEASEADPVEVQPEPDASSPLGQAPEVNSDDTGTPAASYVVDFD